jgi:hypothetical protein
MARKSRKARGTARGKSRGMADSGPPAEADRTTVKAITPTHFNALHARVRSAQHVIQDERNSMGALIKTAIAEQHLDGVAYAIYRRLDKIEAAKRSIIWFHLHVYAERAGWDSQGELFDVDIAESLVERPPEPGGGPGISGAELDAHMAKAEAEADNPDVRPRFLREGGIAPEHPESQSEDELTPF